MRMKTALIGAAAALVAAVTPATGANAQSFSFTISSGDYYPYDYYGYDYPRYSYAYPSRYYYRDRHHRWDRHHHWDRGRHKGWRHKGWRHHRKHGRRH